MSDLRTVVVRGPLVLQDSAVLAAERRRAVAQISQGLPEIEILLQARTENLKKSDNTTYSPWPLSVGRLDGRNFKDPLVVVSSLIVSSLKPRRRGSSTRSTMPWPGLRRSKLTGCSRYDLLPEVDPVLLMADNILKVSRRAFARRHPHREAEHLPRDRHTDTRYTGR